MRSIVVTEHGAPDVLRIADGPSLHPSLGEVRVGVHAAGVNFPDLLQISGKYQTIPPLPFSPGKEVAGEVLSIGAGVTRVKPGDRVMVQLEYGGYGEEVVARQENCFVMPPGLSMVKAAAMGIVYITAWFGIVDRGQFRFGETVLVTGAAGGCGTAAIQIVRALGGRAIGVVSVHEKADFVQAQGADGVIVIDGRDMKDALRDEVHILNSGRGVDIVFDPVGGDILDAALRSLAWSGRAIICGFAGGRPNLIRSNYLLIKHISVAGLHASDYRDFHPHVLDDAIQRMFTLVSMGRIDPPVSRVFAFDEFAAALDEIASRRALGKIVLVTERGRRAASHGP
jgi:NADPH2:quinone reductase